MASERWSPNSRRSRRMIMAATLVRGNDETTAACTQEAALFGDVEFGTTAPDDDTRRQAALICCSCALAEQCPVRIRLARSPRRTR